MRRDQNRRIRIIHRALMILVSFLLLSSFSGANAQPAGPEQYGLSSGFDPSMAIVVVVVVAAFFFIGMFSIFLRQCSEPTASGYYTSYAGAARYLRSRLPHGLDKSVIESFPVLDCSVIKEVKIGEGLECAVCLGEFGDDQSFRLLPKCRHVFHPDCIDMWLASHVTCPVCRANLEEEDSSPSPSADVSSSSGEAVPEPRADEITVPVGDFEGLRPVRITGGKFPRSHSTGHSLAVIDANREAAGVDRYTLRLPEELMMEVIDRARLERAASFNAAGGYFPSEWSSTKGYKGNSTEEGSGRGVVFSMTPPFVSRGPVTVKLSTSKDVDGNEDGGGSVNSTNLLVSVKFPLNFIGGKAEGTGEPSSVTACPLV